ARGLLVIAAPTGGHHIVPGVHAALAERPDMIPRQVAHWKSQAAVHAQIRVPPEKSLIVQRRNVIVTRIAGIARMAERCDDRIDLEHRTAASVGFYTSVEPVEHGA